MAKMIRKQLYLDTEQDRELKELAARWDITEAAVVRKALAELAMKERLCEPDRRTPQKKWADELLRRAGMLGGGWESPIPTPEQLKAMADISDEERALLRRRTERLGGGNAVIADREERERIVAGLPLDD
jgi:hypothetical protein